MGHASEGKTGFDSGVPKEYRVTQYKLIAVAALAATLPVSTASAAPAPGDIEAVAETTTRVADAVMDVPIGPIVDAVDPRARDRDRPETLGDLATRDDPYARERIRDSIGRTAFGIEAMIAQIAVIAPVLRRGIEDAVERMDEAIDQAERRRRD